MRLSRAVLGAVVGVVGAGLVLTSAAWAGDGGQADANTAGWKRYYAASFTTAVGELCDFRLHSKPVFDREFVRTISRYDDGSPRVQQFSGRAVVSYQRNGAYDFRMHGPVAVGFHPGDDGPAPAYYLFRGGHVVHFAASGRRVVTSDHGTESNLCAALS